MRRLVGALTAIVIVVGMVVGEVPDRGTPAQAASAVAPSFFLDATNPASYGGTGTNWNDLTANNRDGTLIGPVTFDATTKSMQFPGGTNDTAYVSLAGAFDDFSGGVTIEFEGEFGATRAAWERIFDFAAGFNSTDDAFWVGQRDTTNELAIEVLIGGVSQDYCTTATSGTALGTGGSRAFAKWLITLGDDAGTNKCRIYKDGVELDTQIWSWVNPATTPAANGSAYPLPSVITRASNFLGRSNWIADNDFEGSIRYVRLYPQALTPAEVAQNATATVTFDANSGTGTMTAQQSTSAAALTTNTLTRSGFTFAGWNTAANGSGTAYADGAQYPFSSDTTLYAQWTAIPRTVTFDANGGTGSMSNQTTNTATALTTNAFTRAGFTFAGWNTVADGSGTAYANSASYPFTASATLYAQWTALANKTVTFDANGGTGSMTPQATNVPTALTANAFTRLGFSFSGWNTIADGSGTAYADAASFPFGADATLFAQWTALASHTVVFDANGGTGTMTSQVANVPTALTSNAFTRSAFVFAGWNTAADGSGTAYAAGATYAFSAGTTLYAQWTSVPNTTVTFAANGGSGSMASQSANVATALTSNAFTRSWFTFAGWNTFANGSGAAFADGATYPFSTSTTLYAQWTPLPSSEFVPVTPKRAFDSRRSTPLAGGAAGRELVVLGRHGVPADATAVMLNVTVTRPQSGGYVTVYPCGETRPETSSINFDAGRDVANHVTVQVGAGGAVCIYSSVDTDVVIDVNGAYSLSAGSAHLLPLTPARLFDTRQSGGTRLEPGVVREFAVAGAGGVPAAATAAVLNVTITEPSAAGYLTVYPCGEAMPEVSNLNFIAGQTVANLATVTLGTGGRVCFASDVATHLVVDVTAAMSATGPTRFGALVPDRAVDTRKGSRLQAGTPLEVPLAGKHGVRADAVAATLNVTVTEPEGDGYLTVYPCGTEIPYVSTLNFTTGQTVANAATVALASGKVCVISTVTTNLVLDVTGAYTPSS